MSSKEYLRLKIMPRGTLYSNHQPAQQLLKSDSCRVGLILPFYNYVHCCSAWFMPTICFIGCFQLVYSHLFKNTAAENNNLADAASTN